MDPPAVIPDLCIFCRADYGIVPMLEAAGYGIAMANADPAVKKAADVITSKDNDNDGLAEFLQTRI